MLIEAAVLKTSRTWSCIDLALLAWSSVFPGQQNSWDWCLYSLYETFNPSIQAQALPFLGIVF